MRNRWNRLHPMLVLTGAGALASLLVACGGGAKQQPSTDLTEQPWEVRVESPLDTVQVTSAAGAPDSTPVAPAATAGTPETPPQVTESPMQPASGTAGPAATPAPKVPDPAVFTPGWRVQIFASASMVNADALAEKARAKFTEPVYVEYEPPLYKVRVGDFLTKREAEMMRTRALSEDFDAWVVESLVVRPKR